MSASGRGNRKGHSRNRVVTLSDFFIESRGLLDTKQDNSGRSIHVIIKYKDMFL
jgi:hypothetical protein